MLDSGRRLPTWLVGSGVIAVAMGIAYGSAMLFGVSFALGAFFAGMLMRESHLSHRAAEESLPFRDAFSVLFFVSVGMLFDPVILLQQPLKVLAVAAIIIVGKTLAAFALVLAFRYPLNTALIVSASLAQIGEFSFILAGLGLSFGLLSKEGMSLILAGALISISVNPLLFQASEPLLRWIRARSQLARLLERPDDPLAELPMTVESQALTGHVVLVGYGLVGRYIGDVLLEQRVPFVVAEQNREGVEAMRKRGIHAVAGDASDPAALIQAHIVRASKLVIATSDTLRARLAIEIARTLNPRVEILVRADSEEEANLIRKEWADVTVFIGNQELARNMAQGVMRKTAWGAATT
jgi:CPA2 family monovalent cation:H+ antiporter-2